LYRRISSLILLIALLLSACAPAESGGQTGLPDAPKEAWEKPTSTQTSPAAPTRLAFTVTDTQELATQPPPTPTLEPTPQPTPLPVLDWVEITLNEMTLRQKVGQLIITGLEGEALTPEMCEHLQRVSPGGVILQVENIQDPQQVRAFVQQIEECVAQAQLVPLLVTVTHEGATVNRFKRGITAFPTALAQGATGDPGVAYRMAEMSGRELAYSGFNMVLGPVADVLRNTDNRVLEVRTFGSDPARVSQFVAEAVNGYNAAGLIPVLKHYPGHGGVAQDSHDAMPIDDASPAELEQIYMPPFASGVAAGAPVIMTSHIAFPQISGDDLPATLSPGMLYDLRMRLGFEGVILSDAMAMKAITGKAYNIERASRAAVIAGVDLLLLNRPGHAARVFDFLVDAVREEKLSTARLDEAVRRVLTLKAQRGLLAYPGEAAPEPNWGVNQAAVDAIMAQTISVLRDTGGNLPLVDSSSAGGEHILVLAPENDWSVDQTLVSRLQERGAHAELRIFAAPWAETPAGEAELEQILAAAQGVERAVVFTWQAHLLRVESGDDWQARLVSGLQASGVRVVVVAVRSPTDALDFPESATVVALFGMTTAQHQWLVELLLGNLAAQGVNPLPDLLP
jgi:beta-N-acetylhexosaminidase